MMRSKYGTYPEYHTSLDDLELISPDGLYGGFNMTKLAIDSLESNKVYKTTTVCEPFLSKRGLRPPLLNGTTLEDSAKLMSNILAYADGKNDLVDIANILNCSILKIAPVISILEREGLIASS
jgi:aminopeptidase-like protein